MPPQRLCVFSNTRLVVTSLVGAVLLGGCVNLPRVQAGPEPSDPSASSPSLAYRSVTAGIRTFRPVEPKGWENLNRDVTPKGN